MAYHDPYFSAIGAGRHYKGNLACATLDNLGAYDCVLIVTDHSDYNYAHIVHEAQLLVDTRNATQGVESPNIVRC